MSKKDAITLGVLAIGGVAVASAVAGGGDSGGVTARGGGILGTPTGGATIYNLPAQADVTFPKAPTFDISRFLQPQKEPSRGAAGVSAAPKKYASTGRISLGYEGYVTPTTPTPVSPGYIPGVTTFVPYKEPAYIPSPIKPPGVVYSSGGRVVEGVSYYSPGAVSKSAAPAKKTPSPALAKAERSYAKSYAIAYGK